VAVHTLDLSSLFEVSGRTPEEACIQVRGACQIDWCPLAVYKMFHICFAWMPRSGNFFFCLIYFFCGIMKNWIRAGHENFSTVSTDSFGGYFNAVSEWVFIL
jgi:hypothetical protein